jgi:hypothetical protein
MPKFIRNWAMRFSMVACKATLHQVDSLANGDMGGIGEGEIDGLFAAYKDALGLIIDIRPNNGGNENYAMMFASHCTAKPVTYGYSKTRQGPRHEDFAPMQPKTLMPASPMCSRSHIVFGRAAGHGFGGMVHADAEAWALNLSATAPGAPAAIPGSSHWAMGEILISTWWLMTTTSRI